MKVKDDSLSVEIEKKREEMYKSISENGMIHPKTLQISQELDWLLNVYQKKKQIYKRVTSRVLMNQN
ncbi:aspartyl-phosphate phosphatase Spo0E family protein [Peribacillus acanthi]|uniref:aspartyl-phosphate phosphatase Spo0E family protein n=1 Tax=Peribacillus acanthi TaxID=2171554 RepID=UPI000D3E3B9F|nr:aspartyl-phosphate phosphatase Spo0E family protein [Peribacillus acanthi]